MDLDKLIADFEQEYHNAPEYSQWNRTLKTRVPGKVQVLQAFLSTLKVKYALCTDDATKTKIKGYMDALGTLGQSMYVCTRSVVSSVTQSPFYPFIIINQLIPHIVEKERQLIIVTVKVCSPKTKLRKAKEVGRKTFNVDPNPTSKSMGYMVGYISALEDRGFDTIVIKQDTNGFSGDDKNIDSVVQFYSLGVLCNRINSYSIYWE